jgi:hypothetical protein
VVRALHDPPDAVHQATSSQIAANKKPRPGKIAPGPTFLGNGITADFTFYRDGSNTLLRTENATARKHLEDNVPKYAPWLVKFYFGDGSSILLGPKPGAFFVKPGSDLAPLADALVKRGFIVEDKTSERKMKLEHIVFCSEYFNRMPQDGILEYGSGPRGPGLVFHKTGERELTLIYARPHMQEMPWNAEVHKTGQRECFAMLKEHFETAGIRVKNKLGDRLDTTPPDEIRELSILVYAK